MHVNARSDVNADVNDTEVNEVEVKNDVTVKKAPKGVNSQPKNVRITRSKAKAAANNK